GAAALAFVRIGRERPGRIGVDHLVVFRPRRGTHVDLRIVPLSFPACSRAPDAPSIAVGNISGLLTGAVLGRLLGRDPVVPFEPPAEIDPGAPRRAKWAVLCGRWSPTDRA